MKKHGYCVYMSMYISPREKFLDYASATTRLSEVVFGQETGQNLQFYLKCTIYILFTYVHEI